MKSKKPKEVVKKIKSTKVFPITKKRKSIWLARDYNNELFMYNSKPIWDKPSELWFNIKGTIRGEILEETEKILTQLLGSLPCVGECWRIDCGK